MRLPIQSNENTGQPMYGPGYLTPVNKDLFRQLSARASASGGGTGVSIADATMAPSDTDQSNKKSGAESTPTSSTVNTSGYGDEVGVLMALVMSQNTPPDVKYAARRRLTDLIQQRGFDERRARSEQERKGFAAARAKLDQKAREQSAKAKAARAAAAEKAAAEEDAAIAAYDKDDAGPAREAGPLPSETEMSRTPVGTTRTPFGQMFGRFQSAPSPSTPAQPAGTPTQPMDPYAQALYNGEITPEQYRQLTEGSQQPNVIKGFPYPGIINKNPLVDLDVVRGYTPDLGIINKASPDLGVINASPDLGVIGRSARDLGVITQNNANNLMGSAPQQSLEALNAAEARLSLGQIGPMQAAELQRIRELKRRLAEDMANRQRGIF